VSETSIAIAPSIGEYFHGPVTDSLRARDVDASPAAETYLVRLLEDFGCPSEEAGSTLKKPVTFLLQEALEATGTDRFRRLQGLGDGVLYGVGFFGGSMRGADKSYFVHVGARAYGQASQMLRGGGGGTGPDVLDELAKKFDGFVAVLADVSDWVMAQSARGHEGLVKVYERWLRTHSPVLSSELAGRGIVASRGPGGIH
jgi:hypothetical protein